MTNQYWGPMFPDAAHNGPCYFGPHFQDCVPMLTVVPPSGPAYSSALALDLKDGARLRFEFETDIFKSRSGYEQRRQILDLPRQTYAGQAYLVGNNVGLERGQLARYAAQGATFLLGLPWEGLTLSANASGTTLPVYSTALTDWTVPGQRVIVISPDTLSSQVCTIQSVTSTTIVVDVAPGAIGNLGGRVVPGVPVLLEPQQGFIRYPKATALEEWQLSARNIMFGYESGANLSAFVVLSGYTAGNLTNAIIYFAVVGSVGNSASLQLKNDGSGVGNITNVGNAYVFHFQSGTTTIQNFLQAIASNTPLFVGGSLPSTSTTLQTAQDVFGPAPLAGGADKNWGSMGIGATVNTYQSIPIWDRGLDTNGTLADSLQSLVELVDLGGVPFEAAPAAQSEWGRQLLFGSALVADWQWLKAFLYTVRGRQIAFWLPTFRADLTATQLIPGQLTITAAIGDFLAWWPGQRTNLMLVGVDGSIQYLNVTNATASGSNYLLTITSTNAAYNAGGGGTTWTSANIALVSWVDLCHFESDQFDIAWKGAQFALSTKARAVFV